MELTANISAAVVLAMAIAAALQLPRQPPRQELAFRDVDPGHTLATTK
jgi:hypothetical protein